MTIVTDRAALKAARAGLTGTVALVPTMGALHEGHLSLVRAARAAGADHVIVSIFVNPLQFSPGEDFETYPRDLEADVDALAAEGVSLVFAPTRDVMYPHDVQVGVTPGPRGEILEGASRPGFFAGVLTVVSKLFHLTEPDVAVFGQKDYQQLTLIRQMTQDLDFPVRIVAAPTVRDPDGLAKSSRNAYLSETERTAALTLSRALHAGAEDRVDPLGTAARVLAGEPQVRLDYLRLTAADLGPAVAGETARLLVAARVGTTRLIDNIAVYLSGSFCGAEQKSSCGAEQKSSCGAEQKSSCGAEQKSSCGAEQRSSLEADHEPGEAKQAPGREAGRRSGREAEQQPRHGTAQEPGRATASQPTGTEPGTRSEAPAQPSTEPAQA